MLLSLLLTGWFEVSADCCSLWWSERKAPWWWSWKATRTHWRMKLTLWSLFLLQWPPNIFSRKHFCGILCLICSLRSCEHCDLLQESRSVMICFTTEKHHNGWTKIVKSFSSDETWKQPVCAASVSFWGLKRLKEVKSSWWHAVMWHQLSTKTNRSLLW